jgi:hypothetical protein
MSAYQQRSGNSIFLRCSLPGEERQWTQLHNYRLCLQNWNTSDPRASAVTSPSPPLPHHAAKLWSIETYCPASQALSTAVQVTLLLGSIYMGLFQCGSTFCRRFQPVTTQAVRIHPYLMSVLSFCLSYCLLHTCLLLLFLLLFACYVGCVRYRDGMQERCKSVSGHWLGTVHGLLIV